MLGDIATVTGVHWLFPSRSGLEVGCPEPEHIASPLATVEEADLVIPPPLQGCLRLISTPRFLSVCDG